MTKATITRKVKKEGINLFLAVLCLIVLFGAVILFICVKNYIFTGIAFVMGLVLMFLAGITGKKEFVNETEEVDLTFSKEELVFKKDTFEEALEEKEKLDLKGEENEEKRE